jgi:hypothetical protein
VNEQERKDMMIKCCGVAGVLNGLSTHEHFKGSGTRAVDLALIFMLQTTGHGILHRSLGLYS